MNDKIVLIAVLEVKNTALGDLYKAFNAKDQALIMAVYLGFRDFIIETAVPSFEYIPSIRCCMEYVEEVKTKALELIKAL